MAVSQRDQALSLLAAANNHGDLAVKLSSLKQAKDVLLSADLSLLSAELFPYLVEIQSCHEALVRKTLVEVIEEISLKAMEYSQVLMPVLLTLLNDVDSVVTRQSIVAGTHIFCKVLDVLVLQRHGMVERWVEEMWSWMIKFKDAVFQIALEVMVMARFVGPRLLAIKFLETCVLLFMPDNDSRGQVGRNTQMFNVSRLGGGHHPVLDPGALQSEANRSFLILLDLLRLSSATGLPGSITISVVNSIATIARRRPVHYSSVVSALLDFDANFVPPKVGGGAHNASIQYSLRTAYLGFLRSTHPVIMEVPVKCVYIFFCISVMLRNVKNQSREKLVKVLRAMNAGDAADQVMRQVDKMLRNRTKDEQASGHMIMERKRSTPMDQERIELSSKRSRNGEVVTDNGVSPVEQMIAMIGALLAEGERGAESLEILISQIHPDLLADIVVTNMKHLPPPPSTTRRPSPNSVPDLKRDSRRVSLFSSLLFSSFLIKAATSFVDVYLQQDPRRHDPRRVGLLPVEEPEPDLDFSLLSPVPVPVPVEEDPSPKIHIPENTTTHHLSSIQHLPNSSSVSDAVDSHEQKSEEESFMAMDDEEVDLPAVPSYVELTKEEQRDLRKMAIKRIIDSYKQLRGTEEFMQTRMALLSRLVAQVDADDDVITMMQKHIVSDYQHQKGHELVMHVLYHLHAVTVSDSDSSVYDKFLLGVAKCLLDGLPASDKSFSRLFSEAPYLPEAAYKLLDEICSSSDNNNNNNGDRVTQGLGSLWTLILGRPHDRQAFLDIALKRLRVITDMCAVHPKDDIRAKAIRLVANKLYVISFISEKIEDFATNKLLSAVNKAASEADQRTQGQMGSEETSISGSQISEAERESDSSVSPAQAQQHLSLFFALCTKKPSLLQLVFDRYDGAPKPVKQCICLIAITLWMMHQAIHRHVPILIRALGASYSDLLSIISDPPQGSENLLTQVLHVLCEGTTPSPELIATVKRLYETKLKDASILIPILSSFTNKEIMMPMLVWAFQVLPIFPRLVQLPLDKFQTALAHILQGSAHMGPALTPAQVLVAIHDISPDKDAIMDACSACFEQRTVFTQQVLAKALNQMVDQTPLPLLFMRTVIQAMDAFPKLKPMIWLQVDFVMELLSKLVTKQVWRMPKLWVGFLKCISQTQPHSFRVLLQLPSPQLEGALNKYGSLRAPLAAYANQPTIKPSLPSFLTRISCFFRSTLEALGLATEAPYFNNNPDKSAKVEGRQAGGGDKQPLWFAHEEHTHQSLGNPRTTEVKPGCLPPGLNTRPHLGGQVLLPIDLGLIGYSLPFNRQNSY
ncbi:hypothetical protein LXL04_031090 [Taraxacum kok-saghyz]